MNRNPTDAEFSALLKSSTHLVRKGTPIFEDGRRIGYRVPVREFDRMSSTIKRIDPVEGGQ